MLNSIPNSDIFFCSVQNKASDRNELMNYTKKNSPSTSHNFEKKTFPTEIWNLQSRYKVLPKKSARGLTIWKAYHKFINLILFHLILVIRSSFAIFTVLFSVCIFKYHFDTLTWPRNIAKRLTHKTRYSFILLTLQQIKKEEWKWAPHEK